MTTTSRNPWVPMGVVMGATIMVALDTTIVNVALHEIGEDLDAGAGIEWVVTAYLLGVCASQPATGWLADRFGRKPIFLLSLVSFTLASLLCGLAPNLPLLVGARALQGLGGGALIPVGMAIALDLFPAARRGKAMAMWGVAAMAAPAIGPTLGGWLIEIVSWHWLFFINLPFGAIALFAGLRLLPDSGPGERRPFDLPGLLLGSSGLTLAILGVSQGAQWGWTSASTLGSIAVGFVLLAAFVRNELHRADPLIELRMFAVPSFRLAIMAMAVIGLAQYGRFVFIPLQLQELRDYSAFDVGLLFIPAAVAGAVGMQIGGRLVDTVGARKPIMAGSAGVAVAMIGFWQFRLSSPIWVLIALMMLQGLAWGMTMSPSLVAGVGQVPQRLLAQASAMRALAQQVAAAVSVAVLGAVANTQLRDDSTRSEAWNAYNTVYVLGAVASVAAVVIARGLPNRPDEIVHDADTDEAAGETAVALLLE